MCEGDPTSSRRCGTWPPRIGPLTQPPTFAVSPLGTENRVLAHPRNCPRLSWALAAQWGDFPLSRRDSKGADADFGLGNAGGGVR